METMTMRLWTKMAFVLLFVPLVASAQFRDLDAALANINSGFGNGNVQAIVAGIGEGDQVMLQFPGLAEESGFFGRDQAAYLLDGLFNKAKPAGFDQTTAKKVSAEGQYHISGRWTVEVDGKRQTRDLYVTLRDKDGRWSVASIRATSR
jgi:hypothetical protein